VQEQSRRGRSAERRIAGHSESEGGGERGADVPGASPIDGDFEQGSSIPSLEYAPPQLHVLRSAVVASGRAHGSVTLANQPSRSPALSLREVALHGREPGHAHDAVAQLLSKGSVERRAPGQGDRA